MRGRTSRTGCWLARALPVALLGLGQAPVTAQDGQFDLRNRSAPAPTPSPTTAGPVDPDNPATPRPRPAPSPTAAPPPLVLPSTAPTNSTSTPALPPRTAPAAPAPRGTAVRSDQAVEAPRREGSLPQQPGTASPASPTALPAAQSQAAPKPVQQRDLGLVAPSRGPGLWLGLGGLAVLLVIAGWLVWSRWFRVRVRPVPEPQIERPQVAEREPAAPAQPEPAPGPTSGGQGLEVLLEATRMSATLLNTTLSYRLAVTNRGSAALRDVRIDGDMVAAHASAKLDDLSGPYAAVLPQLHLLSGLAPGESVTLSGEIRLPLTAITPIRRGNATFFVPLARLRARGTSPMGLSVEGGGTFLVGQEPGANRKLQPFRLDLGPRNYSNLGQQLLRAA